MERDYPEYTETRTTVRTSRRRSLLALIVGILLLVLLLAGIFWLGRTLKRAFDINQTNKKHNTAVHQQMDAFAGRLETYYKEQGKYPSLEDLKSQETPDKPYTYTVSAADGDLCDNQGKDCTRVVSNSQLANKKLYVIVLDKNNIQKYEQ